MAQRTCFDCSNCDKQEVKDGKVWCWYYKNYYDPDDAYSCNRFEMNSSGGCYLTTACTEAMDLPDNCYELETMRAFRDGYLTHEVNNGKEIIEEYYTVAPEIVTAVNTQCDSKDIWRKLYYDEILPCVDLINSSRYEDALIRYQNITDSLLKKYVLQ